ncbi:DUF3159 domain-containing protein [Paenibacillus sp. TRM 82003]|uniref:DUF3159 domain-containing protein n=1 Tax=Kineococcus sp. TRM81007 TaxID=2925831 RepID=UPI001F5726FE|nr:DUF3159 domain-containing protein [Kineococcus sp. TRM81007]MCI2240403.1 DUF3159 domain-containing protein [Kineococcus sp. TRM81007]MCI3927421.1 DUF3159 domain-containing protein [Paenibacillus sp. TRM 82003]
MTPSAEPPGALGGAGGAAEEATPTTVEEVVRRRLSAALGGWRGLLDSAAPALAFLIGWLLTSDVLVSVGASVAVLLVALVVRIARRETVQHAVGGILATAVAAFIASRTGRAADVFLPGILLNAALAVVFAVSMVARWPVVGFVVGAVTEDPAGWRRDRGVVALCQKLTGLLLAGYVVRVAVQLPLYLADRSSGGEWTTALAVSKLVLGWPLLVLGVVVAGTLLLRGRTPLQPEEPGTGPEAVPERPQERTRRS